MAHRGLPPSHPFLLTPRSYRLLTASGLGRLAPSVPYRLDGDRSVGEYRAWIGGLRP
jgi:hypothetical protein